MSQPVPADDAPGTAALLDPPPPIAPPATGISPQSSTPPWIPVAVWLAFLVVTLIANSGALRGHEFLWTDRANVSHNTSLNSLGGLQQIWAGALEPSKVTLPSYAPLAQATFFVDRLIWGDRVAGYRLTSCLLHATCGLMIWWLLRRLAVPGALVIALLFVAHPMTVESVSLLSERRTILAGLFGAAGLFLAMRGAGAIGPVVGARFDALPPEPSRLYALAAAMLALALFAQPAVFAVAGVALLIVWWKRQPIDSALVSLCIGTAVAGIALLLVNATIERAATQAPAVAWNRAGSAAGDLAVRAQVAGRATAFYVQKLIVPFPLMTDYPRWQTPGDVGARRQFSTDADRDRLALARRRLAAPPDPYPQADRDRDVVALDEPDVAPADPLAWFWPLAVVAVAAGGIVVAISRNSRGAAVAIGSFALLLLPVLGFVDLGWMRDAFVADHFAYFASVPLLAGIVALLAPFLSGPAERLSLIATLALVTAAYVGLGANVSRRYADAFTFWQSAAQRNARSPLALQEYADAALAQQPPEVSKAAAALEKARYIRPSDPAVYVQIARVYSGLGYHEEARSRLKFAMESFPNDARAFAAAADGFVAEATTRPTDPNPRKGAFDYYQKAVERNPRDVEAQVRVGEAAYEIISRIPDRNDPEIPKLIDIANDSFIDAEQLAPYDVDRLVRMARVLVPIGRLSFGGELLKKVIALDPNRADAYPLIAEAAILNHDARGAEAALRESIRLAPDDAAVRLQLGEMLGEQSRFDEARAELTRAIELGSPDAKKALDALNATAATRPAATTLP